MGVGSRFSILAGDFVVCSGTRNAWGAHTSVGRDLRFGLILGGGFDRIKVPLLVGVVAAVGPQYVGDSFLANLLGLALESL